MLMFFLLFGQVVFYGVSDLVTLAFVAVTAIFLFVSIRKIHTGYRRALRCSTQEGSWLYKFLSNEKSLGVKLISLLSSLFLSTILVVLVKGMVLQQGYVPFFVVIIVASLVLYGVVNGNVGESELDKNLNEDVSSYSKELVCIFYGTIILNFILSFSFSAYDTFNFKTSDVSFDNFTEKALEISINKNAFNEYTRIFVNAYILMDLVKVAMTKMFIDLFGVSNNFYGFYIVIFILNSFKFFAFSLSFVLLQKGFYGIAVKISPYMNNFMNKLSVLITKFFRYIADEVKSKKEKINE